MSLEIKIRCGRGRLSSTQAKDDIDVSVVVQGT